MLESYVVYDECDGVNTGISMNAEVLKTDLFGTHRERKIKIIWSGTWEMRMSLERLRKAETERIWAGRNGWSSFTPCAYRYYVVWVITLSKEHYNHFNTTGVFHCLIVGVSSLSFSRSLFLLATFLPYLTYFSFLFLLLLSLLPS